MANFTDDKINAVWEKAKKVDGQDSNKYRQDIAGAWMQRDKYGMEESFGWEVDHMLPETKGGNDNTLNLQALQWENNRSKADNFPNFMTSVSSNGINFLKKEQSLKFTESFIATLKQIYTNNQYLK